MSPPPIFYCQSNQTILQRNFLFVANFPSPPLKNSPTGWENIFSLLHVALAQRKKRHNNSEFHLCLFHSLNKLTIPSYFQIGTTYFSQLLVMNFVWKPSQKNLGSRRLNVPSPQVPYFTCGCLICEKGPQYHCRESLE